MYKKTVISILILLTLIISSTVTIGLSTQSSNKKPEEIQTDFNLKLNSIEGIYGLVIPVNISQNHKIQTAISKLVNELLRKDIKLYWIASDLSILSQKFDNDSITQKREFETGSYLALTTENKEKYNISLTTSNYYKKRYNVTIFKILELPKILEVYKLNIPKIAFYNETNVGFASYSRNLYDAGFIYQKILSRTDILQNLTKENFNIIIWGGGNNNLTDAFKVHLSIKGFLTRNKIRHFIDNGGGYVGSCYGGFMAASNGYHPIGLPREFPYSGILNFFPLQLKLIDASVFKGFVGVGSLSVRITNPDNPITFGLPEIIENNNMVGGPIFIEKKASKSNTDVVAVVEDTNRDTWIWGAMMQNSIWWNSKIISYKTKMCIANRWMNYSIGKALWVTGEFGKGKVVAFGSHPEFLVSHDPYHPVGFPPRVIYNSVFYATSDGPSTINFLT